MARKDIIIMSTREERRVSVIYNVINGQITQLKAGNILGLCARQVRRITKAVREHGARAIVHKSRGRSSHAAKPIELKNKALVLCRGKYKGFNPTFAAEKLFEINKLKINPETLRLWFIEADIEYKRRRAPKHRSWRPRKECFGEMLQMDGSHHHWFGERRPESVLMGYIDDATGKVYDRFYDYEGTMPAMDSFRRYIKKNGIPQSVYLDMHTTYKSPKKPTIEDELKNQKALSQFQRALKELGVDIIYALSAQAKGRVERSFNTHQDRLVKELRLAGIKTAKKANRFLDSYYIPKHNRKFSIPAKNRTNLHRPIPKGLDLDRIFCIKDKACLRNDFTIQHNNKFYQILDRIRAKEISVEESLKGKLCLYYKDRLLKYKLIEKRPKKPKPLYKARRKRYIPPKDHPYRKFIIKAA